MLESVKPGEKLDRNETIMVNKNKTNQAIFWDKKHSMSYHFYRN
jgi:hypothetical protein